MSTCSKEINDLSSVLQASLWCPLGDRQLYRNAVLINQTSCIPTSGQTIAQEMLSFSALRGPRLSASQRHGVAGPGSVCSHSGTSLCPAYHSPLHHSQSVPHGDYTVQMFKGSDKQQHVHTSSPIRGNIIFSHFHKRTQWSKQLFPKKF